jgi:hypothetical protein
MVRKDLERREVEAYEVGTSVPSTKSFLTELWTDTASLAFSSDLALTIRTSLFAESDILAVLVDFGLADVVEEGRGAVVRAKVEFEPESVVTDATEEGGCWKTWIFLYETLGWEDIEDWSR